MITNKELTNLLIAYREGSISKALFHKALEKIAEKVYLSKSYSFANDAESIINESADFCLAKSNKFDLERGKAFNFFATIIGCYFSQINGLRRMKAKHAEKLKNS